MQVSLCHMRALVVDNEVGELIIYGIFTTTGIDHNGFTVW
jgi:hypothetical protein